MFNTSLGEKFLLIAVIRGKTSPAHTLGIAALSNLHVSYKRGAEMHIAKTLSRAYIEELPSDFALEMRKAEATE